jgi:ribonucleotide reductase alpha subunit
MNDLGKYGKIYFAKDFHDIGSDELVNKTLFRLEKNKILEEYYNEYLTEQSTF